MYRRVLACPAQGMLISMHGRLRAGAQNLCKREASFKGWLSGCKRGCFVFAYIHEGACIRFQLITPMSHGSAQLRKGQRSKLCIHFDGGQGWYTIASASA